MPLIAIKSDGSEKIINTTEVIQANRCGNYTDIWVRPFSSGGEARLHQVWDEDKIIWNKLTDQEK